jgi:molybdopterin-guanine dinucleotide biosynthesis protein A
MGTDKAVLELGGRPLWKRQVELLQALEPRELLIAGPPRDGCTAISDAQSDGGPLAGVLSGLRACSAPLLLVLAVDLPEMTSEYLRGLITGCSETCGLVPEGQPVAAVYPKTAAALAARCLADREHSMQRFARRCLAEGLVRQVAVAPDEEYLFVNLNTPEDLLAFCSG